MKNKIYQPNDFSDGYDKVGNAEAIVQYMQELQNAGVRAVAPATVTTNTVIWAYVRVANKVNKDAHLKAENVLRDMIHLRNNGNPLIEPDHRSYNQFIIAWVNTKQPNSADKSDWWLHGMWEEHNEIGN